MLFWYSNMYTNLPKFDNTSVILNMITSISDVNQNARKKYYVDINNLIPRLFKFHQQYYKQTNRLSTDVPTSEILAETCLEHIKHTQIYPLLIKHQTTGYLIYSNDILITYDRNKTSKNEP
jgi:hypothetical protein